MYSEISSKLGAFKTIEVFRHTHAVRVSDTKIEIHYNDHPIVTLYADGEIFIDHGGMTNRGVKDRINKFLPQGYQININFGHWYMYTNKGVAPYKNPYII